MRIAVVSSFVRGPGSNGEDRAVLDQCDLLAAAGQEVRLFARRTDDLIDDPLYPLRAAYTVATGRGPDPLADLAGFHPDVVHVHNTYPNVGRRWAAAVDAAVVVTMHSYRAFCAAATFFRDGRQCTDCLTAPMSAVRHGCYYGPVRSLPYAIATARQLDPLLVRADRIIALNERMAGILVDRGYPAEKVVLGTNVATGLPGPPAPTVADPAAQERSSALPERSNKGPWLFVGRLTDAKGIRHLLSAWPAGHELDVVGTGPLAGELTALARPGVRLHGHLGKPEVMAAMRGAVGLVLPSVSFEMLPLTYIEALSVGLPTLAFDSNDVARLVRDQGTGATLSWEDDLGIALKSARGRFPALADHCRDVFARTYSPSVYVRGLEAIYQDAIASRR